MNLWPHLFHHDGTVVIRFAVARSDFWYKAIVWIQILEAIHQAPLIPCTCTCMCTSPANGRSPHSVALPCRSSIRYAGLGLPPQRRVDVLHKCSTYSVNAVNGRGSRQLVKLALQASQ